MSAPPISTSTARIIPATTRCSAPAPIAGVIDSIGPVKPSSTPIFTAWPAAFAAPAIARVAAAAAIKQQVSAGNIATAKLNQPHQRQ